MELLTTYSNNPTFLSDLRMTLAAVSQDDPEDDEPGLGGTERQTQRWWSMASRLSAAGIEEVIEHYQAGMTAQALADKFSVSLSSIKRILRARGVRRLPEPPS
ncbi:MAG TPA: helix-turn-helix domain-containing protein [Bacillota bacterium]|nr:helix-turn-helix domain-containing protein [Bacillota bacterium]